MRFTKNNDIAVTDEILEKAFELAVFASQDYHVSSNNIDDVKKIYLEKAKNALDKR